MSTDPNLPCCNVAKMKLVNMSKVLSTVPGVQCMVLFSTIMRGSEELVLERVFEVLVLSLTCYLAQVLNL